MMANTRFIQSNGGRDTTIKSNLLWADLEIGMVSLQRYFVKSLEKLNINEKN